MTLERLADVLSPRSVTGTVVRVCIILGVLNAVNLALEFVLTGLFWETLPHHLLIFTAVTFPMVFLGAKVSGSQFELQNQMRQLSRCDPLTGIANRRAFFEELEDRLKVGKRGHFLLLDADHFKAVNDRYGHQVGDQTLVAIAENLRAHVRRHDLFGRIGGEEFCVFLEGASLEDARTIATRLVGPVAVADVSPPLQISSSVGVASFEDGLCLAETFRRADTALYVAKSSGRARAEVWAEHMAGTATERAASIRVAP